jgi:hypothetical protein
MDDFDVVVDALQKHRDRLWDMSNRNMSSEYGALNVMDDIRFYQIEQLDKAIMARKNKTPQREWVGLTDEERLKTYLEAGSSHTKYGKAIETKLKDKNNEPN